MPFPAAVVASTLEIVMALAGAILLWRFALSPAARRQRGAGLLAPWKPAASDFVMFVLYVTGAAFVAAAGMGALARAFALRGDAVTIVGGAGAQLGMLGGALAFWMRPDAPSPSASKDRSNIFASGAATFLVSLPLLILVTNAWEFVLRTCGLPVDRQDLIGIFAHADSALFVALLVTLAVVIAPLTEELVFRAGLYRFLRGVAPRAVALLVSALFFASLHVNWSTRQGLSSFAPLTLLAVILSLAYERTGHIGTPIVAHALFNLNTVMLIFSGAGL